MSSGTQEPAPSGDWTLHYSGFGQDGGTVCWCRLTYRSAAMRWSPPWWTRVASLAVVCVYELNSSTACPAFLESLGGVLDTFPTGDSIVLMGDFNTCGHDMTVTPGRNQQVRGAIKLKKELYQRTEVDLTKTKSPCWQASSSVARCRMWRRPAPGVSTLWMLWDCLAVLFGGWRQCWDGGTSIKKGGPESEFLLQGDRTSQPKVHVRVLERRVLFNPGSRVGPVDHWTTGPSLYPPQGALGCVVVCPNSQRLFSISGECMWLRPLWYPVWGALQEWGPGPSTKGCWPLHQLCLHCRQQVGPVSGAC